MPEETWNEKRIAEARGRCEALTDVYLGDYVVRATDYLSLLDALESARAEREAQGEHIHHLERYIRDPGGSTACTEQPAFDPPCGGCEGCITAQVIYSVTGKAVVG